MRVVDPRIRVVARAIGRVDIYGRLHPVAPKRWNLKVDLMLRRRGDRIESIAAAKRALRALDTGTFRLAWCEHHRCAGDPHLDCWGAGVGGIDDCESDRTPITVGRAG